MVSGKIPPVVAFADELSEVLVAGHQADRVALVSPMVTQGADDVVGFEPGVAIALQAHRLSHLSRPAKLPFEFLGRGIAVGLVVRVDLGAITGGQRFVECDADVLGLGLLEQAAQEAGKAVNRVGGFARAIEEFVRQRVPGTEDIDAGVDQVNRW